MVTDIEARIYHQVWGRGIPRRFPVEVEVEGTTILVSKAQCEDILSRVATEQYEQYLQEVHQYE